MKFFLVLLFVLAGTCAARAQNAVVNLLTPVEAATPGGEVRVDLVVLNPAPVEITFATPLILEGRLEGEHGGWPVQLRGQVAGETPVAPRGFSSRSYGFTVPAAAQGRLVLTLKLPQPVRAVIDVKGVAAGSTAGPGVVSAPLSNVLPTQPAASAIQRTFAGRFGTHDPVYFVYGGRAPAAKFQFSFKYRLLGDKGELGEELPALRGLYFAFTQRSLWDINGNSSPFYDTSYMPELMFESQALVDPGSSGGFKFLGYQAGLRHESNGRDGPDSRSLNIAYIRPAFAFGRLDSWNLILAPRVFTYFSDLSNNPDIRQYRGNLELMAIMGRNDRFALAFTGRIGEGAHKGSLQTDLTIPVKFDRMFDFATYILVQYWNGYGESLRDYNRRSSTVRVGFSLVR